MQEVTNGGGGHENFHEEVRNPIIKQKRRTNALPLETKVDLSGEFAFSNMCDSIRNDDPDVNEAIVDEFKIKGDVRMYNQLPGYDASNGLYL